MDLVESEIFGGRRHPWEVARVDAVRLLLRGRISPGTRRSALDLGCGDGFVSDNVFGPHPGINVDLVDIGFTAGATAKMDDWGGRFRFHRSLGETGGEKYDMALLLDVLEHEVDDAGLLAGVGARLSEDGVALVTVPAFQALFSAHDRFLRHHRRYSLTQLTALAERAGLEVAASGYLFFSLLAPRALATIAQRLGLVSGEAKGVGGWKGGPLITALIAGFLRMENRLLINLSGLGLRLPGLTAWMICQKPPL